MHHLTEAQWIAIAPCSIDRGQLDDLSWHERCAEFLEEHRGEPEDSASIAEMMDRVVRGRLAPHFAALTYLH